jgi:hypothetical protein
VAILTTRKELGSCLRALASFIIIIAPPTSIQGLGIAMVRGKFVGYEMHALSALLAVAFAQLFEGDFTELISPVRTQPGLDRKYSSGLSRISRPSGCVLYD